LAETHEDRLEFTPAIEEYERVVALASGKAQVFEEYSDFAGAMGRFDAAIAAGRRTVLLDPLNPTVTSRWPPRCPTHAGMPRRRQHFRAFGVLVGLNIFWALVAVICGTAVGAIFMAGHSAQGPHLGIPQMIQSRAQFGVYGAALPLVIMVVSYILFTAANCVMIRTSIQAAVPMTDNTAIVVFSAVSLFIAFVGYELIHRVAVWMSVASLILFAVAGGFALTHAFPAGSWTPTSSGINLHAFMIGLMGAASWSIGFAPFVADYSRYLPQQVRTSHTFWYSYAGQFLGAVLVMAVGAILKSLSPHAVDDPGNTVAAQFPHARWVAYLVIVLSVLESNVMNVYSTCMSATTIFTGFNGAVRIARSHKLMIMTAASCLATGIAMVTQYHFADYFSDILTIQLYICVPWTAINLCDFYLVPRGLPAPPYKLAVDVEI
jgi:nucleobase:cation symporter-1, NCS1 family